MGSQYGQNTLHEILKELIEILHFKSESIDSYSTRGDFTGCEDEQMGIIWWHLQEYQLHIKNSVCEGQMANI